MRFSSKGVIKLHSAMSSEVILRGIELVLCLVMSTI